MDNDRGIVAVKWLSAHIEEPLDTLKSRRYNYEEEWDWNVGEIAIDPLGIVLKWDPTKQLFVPYHVYLME